MIDEKRLDEMQARCEAATEGPWSCQRDIEYVLDDDCFVNKEIGVVYGCETYGDGECSYWSLNDAQFTAHARTDLPDCIAEIRRLREIIKGHESRIKFLAAEIDDA